MISDTKKTCFSNKATFTLEFKQGVVILEALGIPKTTPKTFTS